MAEETGALSLIDTLLGGEPEVISAVFVPGPQPAIIDVGAQTSADIVADALADLGLGPSDLAWIVLTHVHLDHCGATGDVARRFPSARVVVHRRGVRHLINPGRLVEASAAVYGRLAPLYGGLAPVPEERILEAPDGHHVDIGGGRRLRMIETLGHARHHMSVLDEESGAVMAGDALGVRFPGAGPYPATPPPDIDIDRWLASVDRIAELRPTQAFLGHFGPVPDPGAHIAQFRAQLVAFDQAARSTLPEPSSDRVGEELHKLLPIEREVGQEMALERWRRLEWDVANFDGLAGWAHSLLPEPAPDAEGEAPLRR